MHLFRQRFQNDELEKRFQNHTLKQAVKSFIHYQTLLMFVIAIMLIGQIIKQNIIMSGWFGLVMIQQIIAFILSFKWPPFNNNIKFYYQNIEILIATSQIFYYKFSFLEMDHNDVDIYMDIILQVFLIAKIKFNYVESSLIFIYFISIRVYIQISNQFSLASFAYLLSGSYYIIDQYQQEKVKRKLFLKSQRNKQFELLIDEFIDDQVVILEKDEEKVQLIPKLLNKKLPELCDEFNFFLKNALIPQYKTKLQYYLYQSTIQNETLVCQYKNQTLQLTYKVFILKKNQQMKQLVNFQDLYNYMIRNLTFKPNSQYKGKNIMKSIQFQSFYYQFTRYFKHYRLQIQKIRYEYLKYLFDKCRMSVMIANDNVIQFHSDKKLLFYLINLISNIITDKVILIQIEKQMITIQFNT
ncbi:hypothetical protein pb186bvf_013622 [Paramecium bursaria]